MSLPAQAVLLAILLLAAALYPEPAHFRYLANWLRPLGRRRGLVIALAAAIPALACLAVALRTGVPQPIAHDEFSYLLASDTFARGRLTNPTHPLAKFFESYHIIQEPTYQSKYPPGQGLFLALGQALTGYPIAGVWLSLILAFGATAWALQAWLKPRWTVVAMVFGVTNVWILSNWGLTYWGGAVAMAAGALLMGGLRRWLDRPSVVPALAGAVGVAMLANSRPYEGLLFTVLLVLAFATPVLIRERFSVRQWGTLAPALGILALNFVWMGMFNQSVTGDPLTMPYQAWSRNVRGVQSTSAVLFFSSDAQESLRHSLIPSGEERRLPLVEADDNTSNLPRKLARQWQFYLGIAGSIALAGVFLSFADATVWRAVFVGVAITAAVVLENTTGHPHYLAPAAPLFLFFLGKGLQGIWARQTIAGLDGRRIAAALAGTTLPGLVLFLAAPGPDAEWSRERARILDSLSLDRGKHVVIVQYGPQHYFHDEWVYNGADIDSSPVVWARDLGPRENRELLVYFRDRKVWKLDADRFPAELVPVARPD